MLLILYLAVDRQDDRPLIVDQLDENLDNHSDHKLPLAGSAEGEGVEPCRTRIPLPFSIRSGGRHVASGRQPTHGNR
mgnify:CR=1 FL=1